MAISSKDMKRYSIQMHFCVMIVTLVNFSSEITKEGGDVEVVRTEEWTTMCATIVENLDIT